MICVPGTKGMFTAISSMHTEKNLLSATASFVGTAATGHGDCMVLPMGWVENARYSWAARRMRHVVNNTLSNCMFILMFNQYIQAAASVTTRDTMASHSIGAKL